MLIPSNLIILNAYHKHGFIIASSILMDTPGTVLYLSDGGITYIVLSLFCL